MIDEARRCRGHSTRTGQPCKRPAIIGGTVCATHGGSAPQVRRKAAERIKDMLADAIDPNRALREAGRIAYSDIRELFNENGNLLPIREWPEDIARAVAGVEVAKRNLIAGDDKVDEVLKVRLWDKAKHLEFLFKHLGLLTEKINHSGEVSFRWLKENEDGSNG